MSPKHFLPLLPFLFSPRADAAADYACVMNRASEPITFFVQGVGQPDREIEVPAQGDSCVRFEAGQGALQLLMRAPHPCLPIVLKPGEWVAVNANGDKDSMACLVDRDRGPVKSRYAGGPNEGEPVPLVLENSTAGAVKVAFRDVSCLNLAHNELTIPAKGKVTESISPLLGPGCATNVRVRVHVKAEGAAPASASILMAMQEPELSPFCVSEGKSVGLSLKCSPGDKKNKPSRISILTK